MMQVGEKEYRTSGRSIALSAAVIAMGTMTSRVLGLVRDILVAAIFSRTYTDAWLVAFRLPNMFRRIFGEGSLSVCFIPVFVENLNQREKAQELVDGVYTILITILVALTALGIIFSDVILSWIVTGEAYLSIPGKFEITVRMARIMFVYILLVSLYAYFMAILNALKQFGLAAFAPTLWNVAMIVTSLLPQDWLVPKGDWLAWGVVIGGVLQVAILIRPLMKSGYFPKISFQWNAPEIKAVFKAMGPSMIGLGIMQLTIIANTHFASRLPEGTNSWIFWADRILELPLSLFAVSLGTALLPTLSQHWASGNRTAMSETANYYLRQIFFVSIPAAVGLYMMSEPIVDVLYRRGKFGSEDAFFTASILKIYSVAVVAYSGVRVIAPAFYAIKNTWLPAVISGICLLLHVSLAGWFIQKWGVQGLMTSTVLSSVINMVLLFIGYRTFIGPLQLGKLIPSVVKYSACAVLMGFSLQSFPYLRTFLGAGRIPQAISLFLVIGIGIAVYGVSAHALGIEEVQLISRSVGNRLEKKLGRFKKS